MAEMAGYISGKLEPNLNNSILSKNMKLNPALEKLKAWIYLYDIVKTFSM